MWNETPFPIHNCAAAGPTLTKTAAQRWKQFTWKRNGSNDECYPNTSDGVSDPFLRVSVWTVSGLVSVSIANVSGLETLNIAKKWFIQFSTIQIFLFVVLQVRNNQNMSEKCQKLEKFLVRSTGVRRNFSRGQTWYFAHPFYVADDAMQMHVHKTLCPFYAITKTPPATQGRNEVFKGGTIPRAPNHYGAVA